MQHYRQSIRLLATTLLCLCLVAIAVHCTSKEGTGYSASEYPPYKDLINVGDIHSCEPWLYSECLARNIAVRAAEWRKHN